jgi:hypothetical protein
VASARAAAFELDGHQVIEAAAYKRLLAMDVVPGTSSPGVSGRALLATLIATGVLDKPPCFDRAHPRGDCGPAQRLALPLLYWPPLHAGAADLVIDRQIGQRGQCQHFMAETRDGEGPPDPRLGFPAALATTAYRRCVRDLGAVFDGIIRDPYLASWRMAGTYVLMHAIEDSFSAAHVNRDARFNVVHLLSWTLIDWPAYVVHGHAHFPPDTHHAVSDRRDYDYVLWDAGANDGHRCADFQNPYAVPDECLTARARAARDAVVDYLIVTYLLGARARAAGRQPSLLPPTPPEDTALWVGFLQTHVPSVEAPVELPDQHWSPLARPDVFVGVQGLAGAHAAGIGGWGGRFLFGPATPFALGVLGAAGYARSDGAGSVSAAANMSLLLPIIRRFTIGAAPAGLRVACNTHLRGCVADATATLGTLIIPVGDSLWLGLEGPTWSWTQREIGRTWAGLAVGWSHEDRPRPDPPGPEAVATWDPPRPEEVRSYRHTRFSRAVYLAATAVSRPENEFVGAGLDLSFDRDGWDRRAGFAPGAQIEVDGGAIDGAARGGALAVAPTVRAYLTPDRLALTATPALVRVGALGGRAVGADVAARAGLLLDFGRLVIAADSPPLSYVAQSRWHALPFTVRLGLRLD